MFSGIIQDKGVIRRIENRGGNCSFWLSCSFVSELQADQSLAHNGVCLTVEAIENGLYKVTAIAETLSRSNLGNLQEGDTVNLERSLSLQKLIDGHLVQGHVDTTGSCIEKKNADGSWLFSFRYPSAFRHLLVDKGSVTVNGVSLTAFNCLDNRFSVAIIPYTFEHTTFGNLQEGDLVNLEFDIIGKYIGRWMEQYQGK